MCDVYRESYAHTMARVWRAEDNFVTPFSFTSKYNNLGN